VCGGWKARKEKWRHRSVAISIVRFIWNFQIAFRHLKEYRTEYSGALAPENKNDDTEVPSFLTARISAFNQRASSPKRVPKRP